MKHLTGLTLFLLALTAGSLSAQTWENLPEKQITALIEKMDTTEILRIQKNSARPRKGETLYSRERFLIERLVTSRNFRGGYSGDTWIFHPSSRRQSSPGEKGCRSPRLPVC